MNLLEIEKIKDIEITDDDIKWVEMAMGGKIHFDESRINVIKNMDSVDIQAFPGSGKNYNISSKVGHSCKKVAIFKHRYLCVITHKCCARRD